MVRRFENTDPSIIPHGMGNIARWGIADRLLGKRKRRPPGPPAPGVPRDPLRLDPSDGRPRLTWLGHAGFLGSLGGASFLVDPHMSRHAGVLFPRFGKPGLDLGDLPPLSALLVTHNHYDHLDAPTVRSLPRTLPVFVPAGLGRWFRGAGFCEIRELRWWEEARAGALRVTLVPACHWSRRGLADTNRSWWGGFVVEAGGDFFYHAGDTALFRGFEEIAQRFPRILAAMLPVGSYEPAWFMERYHLNPEQAGEAFQSLGARWYVPMHWGTFQLTDEPLAEPAGRARAWWDSRRPAGREMWLPKVGETKVFGGSAG